MKTAITITQWVVRLTGMTQVALGLAFWANRALSLVPLHMAIGLTFVLAVWALAGLARRAEVRWSLVLFTLFWGAVVIVLGIAQGRIIPGDKHWIVQVAHLLAGFVAMALAARLGALARVRLGGAPIRADRRSVPAFPDANAGNEREGSREALSRLTWYALAGLLLTSVHHAYGAYVYGTPWRYHVLFITFPTAAAILSARAVLRARPAGLAGTVARWLLTLTILVVPVVLFGVFEGLYNHVVKDVLYFGGLPARELSRLFPPPKYEMPNDVFFEVTGVLQAVLAVAAVRVGVWLPRVEWHRRRAERQLTA